MATYSEIIASAPVVLAEFYADWCPHCRRMMPVVKEAKGELEGRADVYQFEIDANQELAQQNDVETIPTFIVYKDGQEQWRYSGEVTLRQLVGKVEEYL